ncbi:Uncharacterised protein [Mycobacteroides abscessus subsp. abscessus]|nr:Uncharacterised protein [Mycobacteroides abscessus subsp. abscessus]
MVPIVVPTTPRVMGPSAAINTTNGIGRTMFTTTFSKVCSNRFCSRPPDLVVYNNTPSAKPTSPPTTRVMDTMYRVSPKASNNCGRSRSQFVVIGPPAGPSSLRTDPRQHVPLDRQAPPALA